MDIRAKQLQYELECDASAVAERLNQLRAESLGGDMDLPRARKLQLAAFGIVQKFIEVDQNSYARGSGAKYKEWLRRVPSDVAAVIALRTCLEMCSRPDKKPVLLQSLACEIGRLYELEVRIANGEHVNPLYMQKIEQQIKERGTTAKRHIRGVYSKALDTVLGDADAELTQIERLHLGKFGVAAVLETGLIEQHRRTAKNGTVVMHTLSQDAYAFLTAYDESDTYQVLDVMSMAMQCPPDPWTNLRDGGYLSERRRRLCPLLDLRKVRPDARKEARAAFTAEKMPQVFDTANYLQSIAWSLHQPTVEAITRLWQAGGGVMGVPRREPPSIPACPLPKEWVKEEATEAELGVFQAWKGSARRAYETHAKWRGHVREIGGFLKATARGLDRFWFPVFVDGRGRWYYRGTPNPQGSDMAKASLHFAGKKPLGRDGVYWLKVHIANSLGFDKERLDARAAYVDGLWDRLEAALDAPEDNPEVWGTDAPWCAYAASWELREALRSGDPSSYRTGIPIHMDATCSGLQHLSALLRDEVGGKYVNLYDDEFVGPKQDIYSKVATTALESIKRDLESSDPVERAMAAWWLDVGFPRDLAKKPVNVIAGVKHEELGGTLDRDNTEPRPSPQVCKVRCGEAPVSLPTQYAGTKDEALPRMPSRPPAVTETAGLQTVRKVQAYSTNGRRSPGATFRPGQVAQCCAEQQQKARSRIRSRHRVHARIVATAAR